MLKDRLHSHVCPRCQSTWEHSPETLRHDGTDHQCARCGCHDDGCYDPYPPAGGDYDDPFEKVLAELARAVKEEVRI